MTNKEQDRLPDVLEVINELARKAARGNYLYRGEPKCYKRVSSSLYRQCAKTMADNFDVTIVQEEILKEAKRFIREEDDDVILEQLQHFGYPTNLIDFTRDYHIALFFACDSQAENDGRVILLNRVGREDLREPKTPENRVIAQKSVLVRPSKGFVEPDDTVVIPKGLKRPILEYLDRSHGVNASAIFNDLHGFIKYQRAHESAYGKFYSGLTQQNRGQDARALRSYSRSIALNSRASAPFNNRGGIYWRQGKYKRAIKEFNKAIEVEPLNSLAHYNRGLSMLSTEEWGNAVSDLFHAQSLGFDIASAFSGEFGSVANFERDYNVQLPENIRAMFTPKQ